ncbi:hypothetical protein T310_8057 [Rasamsonia emersonii CBS 393.64]|uniref:Uncharacterized protein n=1 Tax=Rasamsonia emersonii (strain ATCC 16479 / CBS 393.64 / IMI 116815) TaxID=1408163 RepID=A0A0F4YJE5_RASE3|nr:hypothetical protein T310_8057 [Rasamsonia emersonii CBS 393.64]KKA18011.1 hypothetical protein T310_8057 [Rasamsonia emersonii CBS 393.64]
MSLPRTPTQDGVCIRALLTGLKTPLDIRQLRRPLKVPLSTGRPLIDMGRCCTIRKPREEARLGCDFGGSIIEIIIITITGVFGFTIVMGHLCV